VKLPQTTGELRSYFEEHPDRWAALVGAGSAAASFFLWRSWRTKKDKVMVRNGMAMAVAALEVWGLIDLKRGAPIAKLGRLGEDPADATSVDSSPQ